MEKCRGVGLTPRRHRMKKRDDYLRIIELTWRHERVQMVSLHEEHGVSELQVRGKCREIVVNLLVEISPFAVNIPRDGAVREVRPPDDGCRG